MSNPAIAPYGSWKSPITSDLIVAETIEVAVPGFDGDDLYWQELRPQESQAVSGRAPRCGRARRLT